jgi:hypothetical protein
LIAQRYAERARLRHEGHLGLDYVPELRLLAAQARPLGLGPVISVDTSRPLDTESVMAEIKATALLF